jgi:regulatory protein
VELPDDLAQTLRSTELDRARALWQRRFGTPAQDVREQARQMRFLASRGFSGNVIRRVLHDPAGDKYPGKP